MTLLSVSISIGPHAYGKKWWAKVVRSAEFISLPTPDQVQYAPDIPAAFLHKGTEELFPEDILFTGREMPNGWVFDITYLCDDGSANTVVPTDEHRETMRACGLYPWLLKGSGELAACVRLASFLRLAVPIAGLPAMKLNLSE